MKLRDIMVLERAKSPYLLLIIFLSDNYYDQKVIK